MKKLLLVIAAVVMTVSTSAQTKKLMNWGVEAGMNFNTLSFNSELFDSGNRMGFFVGPKVKFNLPLIGLGADVAVLYSLNSARSEGTAGGENVTGGTPVTNTKSLSYLEIPLNLRYSFGLKAVSIYVATGPQFNYCMSGVGSMQDLFGTEVDHFSRSTWGWNVGAGVELMKHLQVGVSYTIPISDVSVSGVVGGVFSNYKQKTVKVRLAYFF